MTISPTIMIRGHIFESRTKAPFVPSGVSVYGAVEYDFQRDRLRCHECGEWFASLSAHIGHGVHDIDIRQYKIKHGLRLTSSLVSVEGRETRSKTSITNRAGDSLARNRSSNTRKAPIRVHGERRNEEGKCAAQISYKIHRLAKSLGRTPTSEELSVAGLSVSVVLASFKRKNIREVMECIGLEPRMPGVRPADEINWI